MFVPPPEVVVWETAHWQVNHRVDSRLPGYFMVSPLDTSVVTFASLSLEAAVEMGPVLTRVARALETLLQPKHLYVSRYGHDPNCHLHFHIIPAYSWVIDAFLLDERYAEVRKQRNTDPSYDGAEITLYIGREWCENAVSPVNNGPSVQDVIELFRHEFTSGQTGTGYRIS